VEYEYDELYRLIEAAVWGGETITYRYDEVGNRLTAGALRYVYDDNDRLRQVKEKDEKTIYYDYDDNGNLIERRQQGTPTVEYVWDDQNRLVKVVEDGEVVVYEYDDDNIRVSQTVDGQKTSFLLDKNRPYDQVLAEFVDGEEVASYVYGLDLISQERNGDDWFYFVDGLGSTRGLTDGSGEVTDAYWYDAYGNLLEHEGGSENDYLFAGEQFDEELGQYYLRQRYYDAATGRFTRRDTWEGRLEEPITLHKYLYANGNPVNYTDPTGLFSMTEISAANSIANILNEIQFNTGMNFLAMTAGGEEPTPENFIWDLLLGLGSIVLVGALPRLISVTGGLVSSIDDLGKAARKTGQGGTLTKAGRALQKHGNRPSSVFPKPTGNESNYNKMAHDIVDEILMNPGTTVTAADRARFGKVIDVRHPDGRGIRYNINGEFIGFLEPDP